MVVVWLGLSGMLLAFAVAAWGSGEAEYGFLYVMLAFVLVVWVVFSKWLVQLVQRAREDWKERRAR